MDTNRHEWKSLPLKRQAQKSLNLSLVVSIRVHSWLIPLLFLFLIAQNSLAASRITEGPARFTIITPNLIRIEYAADGKFTDAPTLFATDRSTRLEGARVKKNGDELSIDTGAILLKYHPDGQPLTAKNLSALIRGTNTSWTPGENDPQNLGGTLRTLDGCRRAVDLGTGLISRSGWATVDDSNTPILTNNWAKSRPNKAETDWYLFGYGLDYHAALKSLAAISGPIPIPRKNLLGIWYSRYWPYTAAEFKKIVQQYSEHGFPLDNIVMDMDWHVTHFPGVEKEAWTGYTWNRALIPDPPALLKWFHDHGLFVTLNDHPADGVQPAEQAYPAFMREMGQDPNSKATLPFDAGSKKYLHAFYDTTHLPLEKQGVDFWWLDWQQFPFTQSIPDLKNLPWLNRYNFTRSSANNRRGVSFSRWGGWGDQKYPIHFSGDADTGWPMLAFEVPFTSTSGNVGCFFWTHDIGGHMGGRNEESYTRWCQFGALSAALRSHSTRNATMDRRPWTYPKWAEDSMRISFRLRSELFPYIYSSAAQSSLETEPLLRPMYFKHPNIEEAYHNAQQYYFGDNLLVAPITMPGTGPTRIAWQRVWFPPGEGDWFNFFTGEKYDAGTKTVVASDIDQFPFFVRGGVPLPMQPYTSRPATAPLKHLVIRCYPGGENSAGQATLYEDDGQTQAYLHGESARTNLLYTRKGDHLTVTVFSTAGGYAGQPLNRSYTVELPCIEKPTNMDLHGVSGTLNYDPQNSTASIEIPDHPIAAQIRIDLDAKVINPQIIHQRAVAAELSAITAHPIEPAPIKQMLGAAFSSSDPSLTTAILAAAGIQIFTENDAPYLYGGEDTYRLNADLSLLDSASATISLASAQSPTQTTSPESITISDGQEIDLADLRNRLPPEDSISAPGRSPTLQMTLSLDRHPRTICLPVHITAPASLDLARQAKATATSDTSDSQASGAIDGVVDGYPANRHHEWSSNGEKAGAAITLTWSSLQTISEVALYDRPNLDDQILAGRLVFSDGTTIPFGELPNDAAAPAIIHFSPKTTQTLRIEITNVSSTTRNTGLSEIGIFK